PVALAGFREAIVRDADSRVERHFIILCFAARWRAGEVVLNEELDEARWIDPAELAKLQTTSGLAEIVAEAFQRLAAHSSGSIHTKPPSPLIPVPAFAGINSSGNPGLPLMLRSGA